jgi:hypothetical protein
MGVRDHDPAVDDLRLGRRVTIVGGAAIRLRPGASGAEKLRRLGAGGSGCPAPFAAGGMGRMLHAVRASQARHTA